MPICDRVLNTAGNPSDRASLCQYGRTRQHGAPARKGCGRLRNRLVTSCGSCAGGDHAWVARRAELPLQWPRRSGPARSPPKPRDSAPTPKLAQAAPAIPKCAGPRGRPETGQE